MGTDRIDRFLRKLRNTANWPRLTAILLIVFALLLHFSTCEWSLAARSGPEARQRIAQAPAPGHNDAPEGRARILGIVYARAELFKHALDSTESGHSPDGMEYDTVAAGIIGLGLPLLMIGVATAILLAMEWDCLRPYARSRHR